MVATAASDVADGPVLNLINKRIRALRKKQNRIVQIEQTVAKGKTINKEQEEVLRSKSTVIAAIDELEKLRQPLSDAVAEEVGLAVQRINETTESTAAEESKEDGKDNGGQNSVDREHAVVEDLLNLIYFGSMFDVKSQNDYTSMMLTRTHERGCCLTYDYVTDDDSADLMLGERDLDLISMAGGLVISRPVDSGLSHKNALQRCVEHAKLWIAKSDQPIGSDATISYARLREKLTKIMGSDYFTATPEIKTPVDYASAAGNYASFQIPVDVPHQVEGSIVVEQQQADEDVSNLKGNETFENQSTPEEEHHKAELESQNSAQGSVHTEEAQHGDEGHNFELKDQQHINNNNTRRPYPNQRGNRGGGSRRGYSNGHGGRFGSVRGGGPYQNGRSNYYDQQQSGNYYPRNYYNNRGRNGGRGGGGNSYHADNAPADT